MTGYGQSQVSREGVTLTTDIQCLNSRYFDMSARLPRAIQNQEIQLREQLQAALGRGKVNLTVAITLSDNAEPALKLNRARLQQYYDLYRQIQEELGLEQGPSLSHFASVSDIIAVDQVERDDLLKELLGEGLQTALDQVNGMRRKEGANLAADLKARLELIRAEVEAIEAQTAEHRAGDLERLKVRLSELLGKVALDESRLLQEVAMLADKRDIAEECTRLRSHMELFQDYADDDDHTGKRLGFLLQEMGREINTLGSKTDHIDIRHAVVRIKSELEKMREQVLNII
ncbi:MAG: YicC family protein [Candidatus Marinimicrobia bacterium]|nr:YicC family protein [Candidatus Neomarinimicrobiota bacterium]